MSPGPKTKAVLLTEIISPYRVPVFNEIAKDPRLDFKVLFMAETEPQRLWRVPLEEIRFCYQVLPGIRIPVPDRFPLFFNPGLGSSLRREAPDVIISGGYHHPSCLQALFCAKRSGKRFILWCESHENSIRLKGFPFDSYRRFFVRSSDGFLVPGTKSRDYIASHGVERDKIWIAPNAVDNDFFSRSQEARSPHSYGHPLESERPAHVVLYVGRMVDSKGIPTLLEAARDVAGSLEVAWVFVGEGSGKGRYQDYCKRHGLRHVYFEGFKQPEELRFYYGIADLFVLPSLREEWGLVLNEAAAAGLPLIASDAAGAAFDLIDGGENGYRFAAGDAGALGAKILEVLKDPRSRSSMRSHSRQKVQGFSPARCADGFVRAILSGDGRP